MDETIIAAGDSPSTEFVEKNIVEDEEIETSSELLESPALESDKPNNPILESKSIEKIEVEPDPPDICKVTATQQNEDTALSHEEPMEIDQSAQSLEKGTHESTSTDKDIDLISEVDTDLEKLAELKLQSTSPHEEPSEENLNSAVENALKEPTLSSKQDTEMLSELIENDGTDETTTESNSETAAEANTETATEGNTETATEGNTETAREENTETATEGNTEAAREEITETATQCNTETATEGNTESATNGNTETATEGITETATKENMETATEGNLETATEGNSETATEGNSETALEGNSETATERKTGTATEGNAESSTEGNAESSAEGNTDTEMSCNNMEVCDDSSQSNGNKDTTIEDGGENTTTPIFMDIDKNKDDNDKATTGTDQDDDVDPIGESGSEWSSQTTTETDDTECIIPDNNRGLTQDERDSASNTDETTDSSLAIPSTSQETPTINSDLIGKYLVKPCDEVGLKNCMHCSTDAVAKYTITLDQAEKFLCSESCLKNLTDKNGDNVIMHEMPVENSVSQAEKSAKPSGDVELRSCAECSTTLTEPEVSLSWESLEFCDTKCILKYQKRIGSFCVSCDKDVREHFLGKYCVRFGFKIRQFCSSVCLVKYKRGLKVCSYCQEDIAENSTGFVANIEKGQFRDFCAVGCLEKYKALKKVEKASGSCAVCHKVKSIEIEYCSPTETNQFCSEPCFVAFKYVNNVQPEKCGTCSKYYAAKFLQLHVVCTDGTIKRFCTKICQIVYINMHRKIVSCGWCKVKKYNFDMIQKSVEGRIILMCSIPCLRLFEVTPKSKNKPLCNNCSEPCRVTYHIANDGGMKNFCTYQCVQDFQSKQNPTVRVADVQTVVPTIVKRVTRKNLGANTRKQIIPDVPGPLPIITSVRSLAPTANNVETRNMRTKAVSPVPVEPEPPVKHILFVRPPDLPDIRNISTMVKPLTVEQETHISPDYADKETQTERFNGMDIEIVPIPIYVPQPVHMYSLPFIKPSPFPLPVPVPILMPLTKGAANGILKEVKSAQPTPSDPYEADLLVMAQLVADADENKEAPDEPMVESDTDDVPVDDPPYSPEPQEPTPPFGDDMLQMAINIATSFTEPAVDLEGALTASTITATASTVEQTEIVPPPRILPERSAARGRKRGRPARGSRGRGRGRSSIQPESPAVAAPIQETPQEPTEKPDANMCLKYTFGVNAWKQWVTNKNNDMEKTTRRPKPFKTDLLQLTSDELNYSLCLFVKEVRKPNGAEYAPDTIYYLCLGIQQYLFENGRIDNIFCDPYYETFTDCLDEICKKFSTLYNDSQYIVTRVEEEHLWESKQLGAHSPHVLLTTLMFFNTKHFNLTNVEEHMQLSFSHIMKHWKRMPSTPGGAKSLSSRNILLRFYPPQSAVEGKSKKKVYEQQENEENPIRCPVKLYEFYLSKCPESVKTRNDVFYLQPERSCVPDSPVWYSTMALATDALEKMLHRVKMVKEINVALLAS